MGPKTPTVHSTREPVGWWFVLLEFFPPLSTGPSSPSSRFSSPPATSAPRVGPNPAWCTAAITSVDGPTMHPSASSAPSFGSYTTRWELPAELLNGRFSETGRINVSLDDTRFHWQGPMIDGAGVFRVAVPSNCGSVVVRPRRQSSRARPTRERPLGRPAARPPPCLPDPPQARPRTFWSRPRDNPRIVERFPDRDFHLIPNGVYAPAAGGDRFKQPSP